jgi:hypothetical protein
MNFYSSNILYRNYIINDENNKQLDPITIETIFTNNKAVQFINKFNPQIQINKIMENIPKNQLYHCQGENLDKIITEYIIYFLGSKINKPRIKINI